MTHEEILSMLGDYVDYLIANSSAEAPMWNIEKVRSGKPNKWNYIDGCMITACLSLYHTTGDKKYLDFSKDFIDYFVQEDGSIKMELADSIESKDATVWTVKLKRDVTFHNGKTLNSGDVVFSLMRHLDPAVGSKVNSIAKQIKEVHETVASISLLLIGAHAAAALYHHYKMRDNTLIRMMPGKG